MGVASATELKPLSTAIRLFASRNPLTFKDGKAMVRIGWDQEKQQLKEEKCRIRSDPTRAIRSNNRRPRVNPPELGREKKKARLTRLKNG